MTDPASPGMTATTEDTTTPELDRIRQIAVRLASIDSERADLTRERDRLFPKAMKRQRPRKTTIGELAREAQVAHSYVSRIVGNDRRRRETKETKT